jgi:hypothetical protein
MTIEEASGSTVESLAEAETKRGESSALFKARRVALETEEWILPQSLLQSLLALDLHDRPYKMADLL